MERKQRFENYSSGGHDHNGNRNSYAGKLDFYTGMTDSSGRLTNIYTAGEFGGIEKIVVYLADDTTLRDTAEIVVAIPGLALLPESPYYLKVGGTKYHHGPPRYQDDHNHWGRDYLVQALQLIAQEYFDSVGEVIRITDISLPYGGEYDICGTWNYMDVCDRAPNGGHSSHRRGENADITGAQQGSRFQNEIVMHRIIRRWRQRLNLNIPSPLERNIWHGNHYHFTITPRR
ncbi:hypothetical protein [Candidatus Kryptobacter tengchongensis]|uniref:Uncharacterized protein n=1 Tax=Kryptobacter tengchongensis TaxID=1643429 RepID=A0A916LL08_KRYT1|nr:hypothetical protein [Candidatus Kryptobacter tengchongensis]CUT05727.1 hypothetical protein JGI25_01640 [Candidatus Kryptobacter tengchongensis]